MTTVSRNGQLAGTATTTIYTVPTGFVLTITKLVVRDESGVSQTVDVYIDNGGAAAATSNRVDQQTVGANTSKTLVAPQALGSAATGKLYLKASNGSLNYFFRGTLQEQTVDAENPT